MKSAFPAVVLATIAGKSLGELVTPAGYQVYLHKLLHEGQRVAICEPVEESLARGPIRREVTRVVTPGTMIEEGQSSAEPGESKEEAPAAAERPGRGCPASASPW